MRGTRFPSLFIPPAVLFLSVLGCSLSGTSSSVKEPTSPIAPLSLSEGLKAVDVCSAIPAADFEAVLGRRLAVAPEPFDFYGTAGASGCMFDAGKDSSGQAYYGYVVLTPPEAYSNQPLYQNQNVSGLGQAAYFNSGADVRQLWVKVNDQAAFVVGIGDSPNEQGLRAIAQLVLDAVK